MKLQVRNWFLLLSILGLSALGNANSQSEKTYIDIEWTQLMPADDLEALLNPPEFLNEIEDGASNDNIESLSKLTGLSDDVKRFKQALKSTRVIEAFDQANVRFPGFIVPIESDEQRRVTTFFVVPYFGACLHLPPPPPNQIIYVETNEGIELTTLHDPYWFEGTLIIKETIKGMGSSAYTLHLDDSYPFEG